MREFKASTKKGQQLLDRANSCCWSSLHNLYDSWSTAKQNAFDWCWEQYCKDENSTAFGIGNANTFGFSASWLLTVNGENACRLETKDNSYLIWLDR